MSSVLEFEGKNIDLAVEAASDALNIPKAKLKFNIISHGSTGIFGLVGAKKAKINVTVPEEAFTPPVENKAKEPSELPLSENGINDDDPDGPNTESADESPVDTGQAQIVGADILRQILDTITSGTEISVTQQGERLHLDVQGGNAALLIGKRGQTLDAIQYIVEKVVNKQCANRTRVQVDIEGYLKNRQSNLKQLAIRLAEKTKKTGKPSTLGQMNAHDRRIVHLTLKSDKKVRTQSMGDGFMRKLVIFPKKNTNRRKKAY